MTIFADASALVAIGRDEPEAAALLAELAQHPVRLTSSLALWETARAFAKSASEPGYLAWDEVERLTVALKMTLVTIGAAEGTAAFDAHARYGKGSGHRAKLNMGDCFTYACAKANEADLLYKGDDFSHTDLA